MYIHTSAQKIANGRDRYRMQSHHDHLRRFDLHQNAMIKKEALV